MPWNGMSATVNGDRLVEVHVFHKSICVEEIVALPPCRKRRQRSRAELSIDIFARAKDHVMIVDICCSSAVTSP